MAELDSALLPCFGKVRLLSQQRGEITICSWGNVEPPNIRRRYQTRKKRVCYLRAGHFLLAITHSDIARPIADVFTVRVLRRAKIDHGMTALAPAYVIVPKDFHEIARLRLREI